MKPLRAPGARRVLRSASARWSNGVHPQRCSVPPRTIVAALSIDIVDGGSEDSEGADSEGFATDIAEEPIALAIPAFPTLQSKSVLLKYGKGQEIKLETGEIGRQAGGAVMATSGETIIYVTACASQTPSGDGSFAPLTVNYAERFSAAGKTAGGFVKRDRFSQTDALTSRLVDRPLRPLFPKGWAYETQVLEWVLSYDPEHNPHPLAITAASAALLMSDIPYTRAVAGVQVALLLEEGFVVNPTAEQMARSSLDLMMAGTSDAVLMIEGFCDFLSDDQMVEAISVGQAAVSEICGQLQAWAATVSKEKRTDLIVPPLTWLRDSVVEAAGSQMDAAYQIGDKQTRGKAVEEARSRIVEEVVAKHEADGVTSEQAKAACKAFEKETMRRLLLERGIRPDARAVDQVRPIASRCGLLPRTHGSALFTRGETQAICVTTLGSESAAQMGETLAISRDESAARFYLHYHFPPSSVGEVGRVGAMPGRREIGHGMLAQRALAPAMPDEADFPYVVRVESHITDSNGSSSMASVCGGCLSLLDAGVPVKRRVAGIAMGLVLEPDGSFVVLTDILGLEDALGDMDFKVAGDSETLTAFQMDIKVEGITIEIMRSALASAKVARVHILQEMEKADPPPRMALSKWAPIMRAFTVPADKIGLVIGAGGKTIRSIQEDFKVDVEVNQNGRVMVTADSQEKADRAVAHIRDLLLDITVGMVFKELEVVQILENNVGAIVALPGGRDAMVHISELSIEPVETVASVVQVGQKVEGIVISESMGKYKVSLAAVKRAAMGLPIVDKSKQRDGRGRGGRSRGGRGRDAKVAVGG